MLYRPQGADAGRDEISVTDAEAEISYYEGEGLPLDDVLARAGAAGRAAESDLPRRLQRALSALWQEFEPGACSCAVEVEEPRWAALKEIRDKLAH